MLQQYIEIIIIYICLQILHMSHAFFELYLIAWYYTLYDIKLKCSSTKYCKSAERLKQIKKKKLLLKT